MSLSLFQPSCGVVTIVLVTSEGISKGVLVTLQLALRAACRSLASLLGEEAALQEATVAQHSRQIAFLQQGRGERGKRGKRVQLLFQAEDTDTAALTCWLDKCC